MAPSQICSIVVIVGSVTLPLKTSLILDGEKPPLYESLYADILFLSNNSIIRNIITQFFPTFL